MSPTVVAAAVAAPGAPSCIAASQPLGQALTAGLRQPCYMHFVTRLRVEGAATLLTQLRTSRHRRQ
jgi:hypothetical protein